jgi:hypothetical protein
MFSGSGHGLTEKPTIYYFISFFFKRKKLSNLLYFGRKEVKNKLYNDDVRKNIISTQNDIICKISLIFSTERPLQKSNIYCVLMGSLTFTLYV